MRGALLILLLAGCAAAPSAPSAPVQVPSALQVCPDPVRVPPPPRQPRTPEMIAAYATRLDEALVKAEAARAACASRLARLNAWILEHRQETP
jgi:hypothetical protein